MPPKRKAATESAKAFTRTPGLKYYVGAHVSTTDGK